MFVFAFVQFVQFSSLRWCDDGARNEKDVRKVDKLNRRLAVLFFLLWHSVYFFAVSEKHSHTLTTGRRTFFVAVRGSLSGH